MEIAIGLTIIALLSWLAFKVQNTVMFMMIFGGCEVFGFQIPDLINGSDETTVLTLALGVVTMVYGFVMAGYGVAFINSGVIDAE